MRKCALLFRPGPHPALLPRFLVCRARVPSEASPADAGVSGLSEDALLELLRSGGASGIVDDDDDNTDDIELPYSSHSAASVTGRAAARTGPVERNERDGNAARRIVGHRQDDIPSQLQSPPQLPASRWGREADISDTVSGSHGMITPSSRDGHSLVRNGAAPAAGAGQQTRPAGATGGGVGVATKPPAAAAPKPMTAAERLRAKTRAGLAGQR